MRLISGPGLPIDSPGWLRAFGMADRNVDGNWMVVVIYGKSKQLVIFLKVLMAFVAHLSVSANTSGQLLVPPSPVSHHSPPLF